MAKALFAYSSGDQVDVQADDALEVGFLVGDALEVDDEVDDILGAHSIHNHKKADDDRNHSHMNSDDHGHTNRHRTRHIPITA